jgi:hypothetical protein
VDGGVRVDEVIRGDGEEKGHEGPREENHEKEEKIDPPQ